MKGTFASTSLLVSTFSGKVLGLSLPSVALVAEGAQLMLIT